MYRLPFCCQKSVVLSHLPTTSLCCNLINQLCNHYHLEKHSYTQNFQTWEDFVQQQAQSMDVFYHEHKLGNLGGLGQKFYNVTHQRNQPDCLPRFKAVQWFQNSCVMHPRQNYVNMDITSSFNYKQYMNYIHASYDYDRSETEDGSIMYKKFSVSPGNVVHVYCPFSATNVDILQGDLESVAVEVSMTHGEKANHRYMISQQTLLQGSGVSQNEDRVTIEETSQQVDSQIGSIKVWIPERYCSIDVMTMGGNVTVQGIKEAKISIQSNGGNIYCGQIQGSTSATLNTDGGHISGLQLSATDVQCTTNKGNINIDRITGNNIHIHTQGGQVLSQAVYVNNLNIDTYGGDITIGNLDCNGEGQIELNDGSANIGGLDGNLNLISYGGDVNLQFNDNVGKVYVYSEDGIIRSYISGRQRIKLEVAACGGIEFDKKLKYLEDQISDEDPYHIVREIDPEKIKENTEQKIQQPFFENERVGIIQMGASRGQIFFILRSWVEAITQKIQSKNNFSEDSERKT